jgi:histone-lysine N-methyltransferase SETD3
MSVLDPLDQYKANPSSSSSPFASWKTPPLHYANIEPILEEIPDEMWQLALGIRLLSERTKGITSSASISFFRPYIDMLPISFQGVPIFFNANEQAELQYAPIQQQIRKRAQLLVQIQRRIDSLRKKNTWGLSSSDPFSNQPVTVDLLGWGLTAASSRAFLFGKSKYDRRFLPLIDFCNHSPSPTCSISFDITSIESSSTRTPFVELKMLHDVEPNEELTISYGKSSNDHFLIDFGFVEDDNTHDTVLVRYDLNNILIALEINGIKYPQLSPRKKSLIDAEKIQEFTLGRELDTHLLAVLRVICTPDDEFEKFSSQTASLQDLYWTSSSHPNRSHTIETLVQRGLLSYLQLLLEAFPTTIDQDIKLLAESLAASSSQTDSFTPTEIAIRYRLGEKRLLREHILHIKTFLKSNTE